MTEELARLMLRGLPPWVHTLHLSGCAYWPMEPAAYTQAFTSLQSSCEIVHLPHGIGQEMWEAVMAGMRERDRRAGQSETSPIVHIEPYPLGG